MFKKIKDFFYNNFFSPNLVFEYRAYSIFFFIGIILSIVSFVTNLVTKAELVWLISQLIFSIVCIVVVFIPLRARMKVYKPLLVFASLVYLPYMYFPTAGSSGTCLLFVSIGILLLAIVFRGRKRQVYITINILTYIALAIVEYIFPDLAVDFANPTANLVDLIVAIIVAFGGFAGIAVYISNAYQSEKKRISTLLEELENNNQTLEQLTIHDSLTGAYNRRYFVKFINDEIAKWPRIETQMYLILLDIDNFKKINEAYGHLVGDEILVDFVKVIQSNLRSVDFVARYASEEFVVVVFVESLERAVTISERIRTAVSEIEFCDGLKITLSSGVAQYRGGESYDALVERATGLLTKAKKHGRNRTIHE